MADTTGPDDISTRSLAAYKPPLPTLPARLSQQPRAIEVQLPPPIAGAIVSAFAAAVADGLDHALLAHYYLPDQPVRVNLDRVVDRLVAAFNRDIWDELFSFYEGLADVPAAQVTLLFEGPVRQLVLALSGPETSQNLLDRIGPGLSRRRATWSAHARGLDLSVAMQLLCSYWHREHASQSPGGNPDALARVLHRRVVDSEAARTLIAGIRRTLVSPHYVQMHMMESAVWDIISRRPSPPPADGFHVLQFRFQCPLFGPQHAIADPQLATIGSLPALTGTAGDCVNTSIEDYVLRRWPRCGRPLLTCLEDAVRSASEASRRGGPFSGTAVWDGTDGKAVFSAGLRLLHVEVEEVAIRLSVSAWVHTVISVLQQMAWTCATLSASPFSESAVSECVVEISGWEYLNDSALVHCSMSHRPVSEGEALSWVRQLRGAAVARGFPVDDWRLEEQPP